MFNGSRQAASTKASNKSDVAVGDVSKDDKDMDVDVDVEMWTWPEGTISFTCHAGAQATDTMTPTWPHPTMAKKNRTQGSPWPPAPRARPSTAKHEM